MRFWGLVASGLSLACIASTAARAQTAKLPAIEPADQTAIRLRIAAMAAPGAQDADRDDKLALASIYGCRLRVPAWTTAAGLAPRAAAVIAELKRADDWGLTSGDYAMPELSPRPNDNERAAAEQSLSLAVLKYARHARGGRIPDPTTQLASYLDRRPLLPDPVVVLDDITTSTAPDVYLRSFNPQHAEFQALAAEYQRLRRPPAPWLVRIPPGSLIRVGDVHQQIALLRIRLQTPAADGVDPNLYNEELAEKVRKVQGNAGLAPRGSIGNRTREVLNEAIEDNRDDKTARRLRANMEAWRWMPADLGDLRVEVNVPDFMMRIVKDGRVLHSERVVTGKIATQTPIFSDRMKMVVFQPQWGLPDSIKVNEVLPRLLRGDGLRSDLRMQRNGRDIDPDDVDWNKANILEYHIFQPSGDDNALGQVKFLFPNKHQVYMHDTPSKGLFRETQRTYSHGCVRVRNPVRFAEVVMSEDKGWAPKKVRELAWDGPENNKVTLSREIPVHITYFTAATGDDGKIHYMRDVYGHENRIALALDGRWKEIPRLPDHLAPLVVQKTPAARQANDDDDQPRRRKRRAEVDDAPPVRRGTAPPPPVRVAAPNHAPRYYVKAQQQQQLNIFQKIFGSN